MVVAFFVVGRCLSLSWSRGKDGFGMGLDAPVIGLALAELLPSPVSRGDLLPNLQSLSLNNSGHWDLRAFASGTGCVICLCLFAYLIQTQEPVYLSI